MKFNFNSFHGEIIKNSVVIDGLTLSETAYQPNLNLPRHSHSTAYFSFVLQGSFTETYGRRSCRRNPLTLVFHPAGERHSNCFHTATRGFNLQMENQWIERVKQYSSLTDRSADFQGGFASQSAMKLYREFCQLDDLSPLIIEGLTLEILGETARRSNDRTENIPPTWLVRARELLNDQFRENFTLARISEIVATHETHLAREFRRFYGCTIGEYVRRLRIEFACREPLLSNASLTEIALSAGFFDQSHFARTFKSQTGMTPLAYRTAFDSR